jgi:hypothetical protein
MSLEPPPPLPTPPLHGSFQSRPPEKKALGGSRRPTNYELPSRRVSLHVGFESGSVSMLIGCHRGPLCVEAAALVMDMTP